MHGAVALGLLHVASAAVSWSGALDPSYLPCELAEWSCDFCEWADVHEIEGIFTKCRAGDGWEPWGKCGHASWQTCGEIERNDAADQYIKASELTDGALEMHDARMLSSATYDWATQLPLTATATVQDWTGVYVPASSDPPAEKIADQSFSIWLSSKNNAFEDQSTIEARLVSVWVPYGEFPSWSEKAVKVWALRAYRALCI